MVATADLWVYNAENFCVSFFNQVASTFHLRGGKIKKNVFLGLPNGKYNLSQLLALQKGLLSKFFTLFETSTNCCLSVLINIASLSFPLCLLLFVQFYIYDFTSVFLCLLLKIVFKAPVCCRWIMRVVHGILPSSVKRLEA